MFVRGEKCCLPEPTRHREFSKVYYLWGCTDLDQKQNLNGLRDVISSLCRTLVCTEKRNNKEYLEKVR